MRRRAVLYATLASVAAFSVMVIFQKCTPNACSVFKIPLGCYGTSVLAMAAIASIVFTITILILLDPQLREQTTRHRKKKTK